MAVSIYKLIRCRWSAAAWILKQNTCVQHPSGARSTLWCQAAVGSGYRGLYASHVQKQLLPNEADIICPSVLELFIRCLTSATKLLIPSALICRVTKPAHFKFLEDCYIFFNTSTLFKWLWRLTAGWAAEEINLAPQNEKLKQQNWIDFSKNTALQTFWGRRCHLALEIPPSSTIKTYTAWTHPAALAPAQARAPVLSIPKQRDTATQGHDPM